MELIQRTKPFMRVRRRRRWKTRSTKRTVADTGAVYTHTHIHTRTVVLIVEKKNIVFEYMSTHILQQTLLTF